MPDQIREALEAAFNDQEKPEATEPEPTSTPEPEAGGSPENSEESIRATAEEAPAEPKAEPSEAAPKPEEKPAPAATETYKPPQSWRPAVREHWSKLPGEVQAEISKREVEVNRALTTSANARKLEQEFYQVVAPYEPLIRAQNVTPMHAIGNLMQTSARLHLGNPQQKAQVVVEVIKNFGIDLELLDSMLAGQVPVPEEDKVARIIDQRLAPVNQLMQRLSQGMEQRQQKTAAEVQSEIEAFSSQEFFEDVREDMADLMELAAKRGRDLSLQEAYEQAINLRPDLRSIVDQRRAAERAQTNRQTVVKAREAASSVVGSPAPVKRAAGGDIRSAIQDAWDSRVRN